MSPSTRKSLDTFYAANILNGVKSERGESGVGSKERREREKESLRAEILDAARELFVAEGYQNVSMRKIAERIEYSPTTIYLYFKDKSELLVQLCQETFGKLARAQEAIRRKHSDPLVSLREGCRAYIHFGLKHPNHYQVVFMIGLEGGPGASGYGFEGSMGERAFGYLRSAVAACVEQKQFRPVDVEITSQMIWAAIHGLTSLLITHRDFPWKSREKLINHLLDTLIDGMRRKDNFSKGDLP